MEKTLNISRSVSLGVSLVVLETSFRTVSIPNETLLHVDINQTVYIRDVERSTSTMRDNTYRDMIHDYTL